MNTAKELNVSEMEKVNGGAIESIEDIKNLFLNTMMPEAKDWFTGTFGIRV